MMATDAQTNDRPVRIAYYQWTLGQAHMARIRALNSIPGLECRGVELASRERTRNYRLSADDRRLVDTVMEGIYEDLPLLARIRAASAHLEATRPDIIIIDAPADPVQFLLKRAARRLGIRPWTRWAATISDHPRFTWKEWLKGFIYRNWDHYLVTGERGLEYLQSFGVAAEKTTICGNPVDAGPIERARAEASPIHRRSSFLFVGRFLDLKNLDVFVPAFVRYLREGGRWRLRIVGTGEQADVARLEAAAAGVPDIEFLGHLQFDELIELYLHEGALVLPSYSENWGLVVNEAMHAGMPIVISDLCGCRPELLEEGRNGFAFDPHSERSIIDALFAMERLDEREREAMGRRSLEIIAEHGVERWARSVAGAVAGC